MHAVERGAVLTEPLRSAVDAIPECEARALSGPGVRMRRAPRVPVRPDERRSARISPHVSSRPAILVGSAEGAAVSGPPVRRRLGPGCCYQTPERRKDPWAINSLLCAMPHGDMPAGSVFLAGTGRSLSPPIASVRCRLSDFDHVREPFFAVPIDTRSSQRSEVARCRQYGLVN